MFSSYVRAMEIPILGTVHLKARNIRTLSSKFTEFYGEDQMNDYVVRNRYGNVVSVHGTYKGENLIRLEEIYEQGEGDPAETPDTRKYFFEIEVPSIADTIQNGRGILGKRNFGFVSAFYASENEMLAFDEARELYFSRRSKFKKKKKKRLAVKRYAARSVGVTYSVKRSFVKKKKKNSGVATMVIQSKNQDEKAVGRFSLGFALNNAIWDEE